MAQSYFGAGAGQSGSVQSLGGSIAGFDSGNRDKMEVQYYSDLINGRARKYGKLLDPKDVTAAYNDFRNAYQANSPTALNNANFYTEQAKGILSNNTSGADVYERLRSGNLSSLGDVFKNVLDYGMAGQKARLAAGGYGGSGPSAYDRILSSTMTASNMAPVLSALYSNLGRDATSLIGGDRNWDAYRMTQFAGDPLTGYLDAATAGRAIAPLNVYRGLINNDIGTLSNLLNNVMIPNVRGYELKPGLSTKLNNFASGTMNLSRFGTELMGSYGGMMGGGMGGAGGIGGMFGGMGGGGGAAPATNPTPGYYSVPNYGSAPGVDVPAYYGGFPQTSAYA
jgi:hypothetical protein